MALANKSNTRLFIPVGKHGFVSGIFSSILLCFLFQLFASCRTPQELAYLSDAPRDTAAVIENTYAATIHPGDQLYIYVSSQTPESVIPFNEETNKIVTSIAGAKSGSTVRPSLTAQRSTLNGYEVADDGSILFPVIGKIQAAGLTYEALAQSIQHSLIVEGYVTDPLVTVKLMNFRVAVIGEVKKPQELHVGGERLTIFEALAMCGDLTVYGIRDSIGVLRDDHGTLTLGHIDLTSKTLFDSPYYYLQSNDIVYVEPNQKRKRQSTYDAAYAQELNAYISLGGSAVRLAWATYHRFLLRRDLPLPTRVP